MEKTIVSIGRNGDIINLLPLAYYFSLNGGCQWVVGEEFEEIFDGVSYIKPIIWCGAPDTLNKAMLFAQHHGFNPICAQVYKNPDSRHISASYCEESWRLAGFRYSQTWPLIFDKRDKKREQKLIDRYIDRKRKNVLVGTKSISSPFQKANELIARIRGLDCNVVDLDNVKAERIYDLIGLYDAGDLVVTVDTVHLHLARACYTPLIALIHDGWLGSVLPPQCIASQTYPKMLSAMQTVPFRVEQELIREIKTATLVVDVHGNTARHKRSRATWPINTLVTKTKNIPRLKDVLRYGLGDGRDVVIWTNDDVKFKPDTVDRIKAHAQKFPFGCSRRDSKHVGREIFWFRQSWLADHIDEMPDVYIARPKFDLVIARWLRSKLGITTVLENLTLDFPPMEVPAGLVEHEPHESTWVDKVDEETIWNEQMWDNSNN